MHKTKLLLSILAAVLAVVCVVIHTCTTITTATTATPTEDGPVSLEDDSDIPYPVRNLAKMSAALLRKDESASFKASVARGEQKKLLGSPDGDSTTEALSGGPSPAKRSTTTKPAVIHKSFHKSTSSHSSSPSSSSASASHARHHVDTSTHRSSTVVSDDPTSSSSSSSPSSSNTISSGDALDLAKRVSKMFHGVSMKDLASKKKHKLAARKVMKTAETIEAQEEASALRAAIASARAAASTFKKDKDALVKLDKYDAHQLQHLRAQIHRHRHALVSFGRAAQKSIKRNADVEEEAKMLDHAAMRLQRKANKLEAVDAKSKAAHALLDKQKNAKQPMSKRERALLNRNKKLIAHYDKLRREMHQDKTKALNIMKKAALARTKALASMQRAGSLLSQADHSSRTSQKARAKLRGQSGSLTRQAVSLLLGTHQATHEAYELKHKARALEVEIGNMKDSVHAARLSDRILEDPSLLQHPTQFDAAETAHAPTGKQVTAAEKKAKAYLHLAKADRARAAQLRAEMRSGKPVHLLHATNTKALHVSKATQAALLAQEEDVQAREKRRRRRSEAELARQLGDEMNKQHSLRADIKARQSRLEQLQKQESAAERRALFESSVLERVTGSE